MEGIIHITGSYGEVGILFVPKTLGMHTIFYIEMGTDSVFLVGIWLVFLGFCRTNTGGKLGLDIQSGESTNWYLEGRYK